MTLINRLLRSRRLWLLLAVVAFIVQAIVNVIFVALHWMDEGNYVYKGYIAVKGLYPMGESGGPWFEYMPLAFLVPGAVQVLWGPSFYANRAAALVIAALTLLATYMLARKLAGGIGGLISLWLLVGNVTVLRYYTVLLPFPFVALALISSLWVLASDLCSPYREVLAVFLATVALMTRQNMVFAWGIVVLYALIVQRQWRAAAIVAIASVVFLVSFLGLFWPSVVRGPLANFPVVGPLLRQLLGYQPLVNEGVRSWSFELSSKGTARMVWLYFPILVGAGLATGWAIRRWWTQTHSWGQVWRHRYKVLLGVQFAVNLLVHVVGAQGHCPGCPVSYFGFFAPLGAVLVGWWCSEIVVKHWARYRRSRVFRAYALALIVAVVSSVLSGEMLASEPEIPRIEQAAESLAVLTTPEDKIFSLSDMHVFLLAERYPYPPLMSSIFGFVVSSDTETVLEHSAWNHTLAAKWLGEADVIVISKIRYKELCRMYPDVEGSGQQVCDLIEETLASDFELVGRASYPEHSLLFYRRRIGRSER